MQPTLLILAAGMGSRYGGLKQLDAFGPGGETILEYSVYDALRAGFSKVVFVIRPEFEEVFKEKIGSHFADRIEVAYVYQEMRSSVPENFSIDHREKPRGTWHAVLVARDEITTPFAVINADDYYGISSFEKMAAFLEMENNTTTCSMIGYILQNTLSPHWTVNRGICEVDSDHVLTSVDERRKLERRDDGNVWDMHDRMVSDESIVSMNFWGFDPSIFDVIERLFLSFLEQHGQDPSFEFYIPSVVNEFIHTPGNTCKVIPCDAQWCGVTYPDDKEHTSKLLTALTEAGNYSTPLWN